MACTITATSGSASANSYSTIADADAYFATHLYASAWTDQGATEKCQALQMATRLLDQWFDWTGVTASGDQALLWPRVDVIGPNGYLEASDAIPTRIAQACAELAKALLTSDRTADSETETQGVKRVKAGSVEVEFSAVSAKPIPDAVVALVTCYGARRGRSSPVILRRA